MMIDMAQEQAVSDRLFRNDVDLNLFGVDVGFPDYNETNVGDWRLRYVDDSLHKAYFNGLCKMGTPRGQNPILYKGNTVWMGITAREVESHLPHLRFVQGRDPICVIGLGMGFFPYLAYLNGCYNITVYEKDANVIKLFREITAGLSEWEDPLSCIDIVHQDVLEENWHDDICYAHCYVDIWENLGDSRAQQDVERIVQHIPECENWSWWGQEIDFVEWAIKRAKDMGTPPDELQWTAKLWEDFQDTLDFYNELPWGMSADWYVSISKEATERAFFD